MEQLADEGRARGDRMLALEVIEQNPRGVRLYESCGFKTIRRLHGYSGANLIGAAATLTPIDVAECARHISAWSQPDLPWQCSGATLAKADPPHVGYQLDGCYAIITDPNAGSMVVRGLAVPPDRQRQGWGTRLVAALVAAHPGKSWHVPAICPAEFGPLFTGNGFTQDNLSQFQMALTL
jgi:GNAT superfamily N-acetyltransferase